MFLLFTECVNNNDYVFNNYIQFSVNISVFILTLYKWCVKWLYSVKCISAKVTKPLYRLQFLHGFQ